MADYRYWVLVLEFLVASAATKKTHMAAGFFFSAMSIYRIFGLAEVGKNPERPRFLGKGAIYIHA